MGFDAKILKDSISPDGVRLTTFEVTFPRIVLAEFNTHRTKSRNSASSRAIPVEKMIRRVMEDPYIPSSWGKNQKGMQAGEEIEHKEGAIKWWLEARDQAVHKVERLLDLGVHKQLTNRLLEPFMWHTVICTATEWSNFFHLRNNPAAHPDIQIPARMLQELHEKSEPKLLGYGAWHLPLVPEFDEGDGRVDNSIDWRKVSVARCARVSYLTHDGKRDIEADLALHDRLLEAGHMCFDAQTEVLTKRGWVEWPDVTTGMELFVVDIATGEGRFEKPQQLHDYEFEGELYRVVGQQLDLAVTLNHRMVVSARKNGGTWTPFGFEAAEDIKGKPRRYLKAARYAGGVNVPTWDAQEASPAFFRLLGFFVGDGYTAGGNQLKFHLKKKRKIEYLKSLGYEVRYLENDKYVVQGEGIGRWFRETCYSVDGQKRLPPWVLELAEADALALFDGLRNSDGSARRKTWVYSTTSRQVADMLQALLHIHGKVGSFTFTSYGNGKTSIRVNVSDRVTPRVETNQNGRSLSYEEEVVPHVGRVYCATTSTGALLVRRNGHVAVSGNSPFEHVAMPLDFEHIELAMSREAWNLDYAEEYPADILSKCWCGNFRGWLQYRKTIPNEHDILGAA